MSRYVVVADWDNNAPHLTPQARQDLWDSIPAYQKDARTRGIPQLGAGVIYPIPEDDIVCDPFRIPAHWGRGYGMDVGWNRTAAQFIARDPDTGVRYMYAEYGRSEASPEVHAAAIKALASMRSDDAPSGPWIPGRIDPAARGRSQEDGEKLLTMYRGLIYGTEDPQVGVEMLKEAVNAVETGIYEVLMGLQQNRIKVFKTCRNWLAERRLYRRDEKGRVVKKNDHAQDAGRYGLASGITWLAQQPAIVPPDPVDRFAGGRRAGGGWANA